VALECLEKASCLSLDHVPALVHTSKLLIQQGEQYLGAAEGYLDVLTQTNGWDVPEAWVALADVYATTQRPERAKECLLYALQLEETRPIREWAALPRVL
jgi:tetratricopeptide (TPR) repeat protein